MKPLSPKTLFIFSSFPLHSSLRISSFSTSSPSSSAVGGSSFPSRRHEEESRSVRVSVWWDFENCQLPAGANVFRVAQSITAAVRANGIKGPVQITAFGDMLQLSRANQEALSATGVNLNHIPHGGKNSADRSLLVDLMYWVSQNPPPAHLFLISGDRDFAGILHRLRMNNYNVLLASPEATPSVLCSAASIMWHWNALVKGENLAGKYFNQPPDGPYGSWYGYYRVPLEDPFAVAEKPGCLRVEEGSESNSELKLRPVPKAVVKQLRLILESYPNGVSIAELGQALRKSNVIDKELYGYKKFSLFLLSMPHILKLESRADGQHFVTSVAPKTPEPVESGPGRMATRPITNTEEPTVAITNNINGEDGSSSEGVDENPSLPPTPELKLKELPRKSEGLKMKLQETSPLAEKVTKAKETEKHLDPSEEYHSTSKVGFVKNMWKKWFAGKDVDSDSESSGVKETGSSSGEITEKPQTEEKSAKSTHQSTDPVGRQSTDSASFSSSSNEAVLDDKVAVGGEAHAALSIRDPSFFRKVIDWFKFWRKSPSSENLSEQSSEKLNQATIDSGNHEVFLKESFWKEMEAFIDTPPNGSVLVLQSRSREQMAENLQKQGPPVLGSLSQNDLLHLVDLLITKKRWVEECPSQTYPFKLSRSSGKSSTSSNPPNSNGLRSIFLSSAPQSTSKRLLEREGEVRHQNFPHGGVSPSVINKKLSGKSRNDILADCQNLVDDLMKDHPEGFNMGSFRKLFLDRYGYPLDIQNLGYQKLATLLQIMPGVKIESSVILPCNVGKRSHLETRPPSSVLRNSVSCVTANSDGEQSDASKKDDGHDSPWEELGPVANTGPTGNVGDSGSKRGGNEETARRASHDYEILSDDCISDSEDETQSSLTGSEAKPRTNNEDSSLLRILDSWYSAEEEANRKEGSESVDGMVDCSQKVSNPSASSDGAGIKTETPVVNCGRKIRPFKTYSFVSEELGENKDKLIDGILTSLKKSGESRIQG